LDWSEEALVEERLRPEFRAKFETWNATFDMPYAVFRQELKEIAQRNLSRVEGVAHTPLEEVPPGELIVPVDDDDWFAPNVAHEIRRVFEPGRIGYHWIRQVLSPSRRRRKFRIRLRPKRMGGRYSCATNNYALVNTSELAPLALKHKRASEYFDAHPTHVTRIPKTLAIQNRSLASQTALAWKRPTITREELVEVFDGYRDLYANWKLRPELRWAQPCVDGMAELMEKIRVC
jgi:hypothetical protein